MNSAVLVQEVLQRQEPWRWGVQWPAIKSWQWLIERIIKTDPLITTWEVAEEFSVDHFMVVQHVKQFDMVKELDKWMSHALTENQKKCCLEVLLTLSWSVIFSYCIQQQRTISQLDCDAWRKMDFIWQPVMTSSVAGWLRSSKALPKIKLVPKKCHGHCLVVCCPSDPL